MQNNKKRDNKMMKTVTGHVADLERGCFRDGVVRIGEDGRILAIDPPGPEVVEDLYLMPGFVDAHIHLESTLMLPPAYARAAVLHGTVAAVCDPHEIANVWGEGGIGFMLHSAGQTPFHFYFGVPSCVPATPFETSGARLDADAVCRLLERPQMRFLAEVMNFPGVVAGDPGLMRMIGRARALGKPVDGHAPGLTGRALEIYAGSGIGTDHECRTLEEALEKIAAGMEILIREGSAARDFEALAPLLCLHPDRVMFCSDDKHPDDLTEGYIDDLVRRAVDRGYPLFDVLRAACLHPHRHYGMRHGLLRPGDPADFIGVSDLRDFRVSSVWLSGNETVRDGDLIPGAWPDSPLPEMPSAFRRDWSEPVSLAVLPDGDRTDVLVARDRQLYTGWDRDAVPAGRPVEADPSVDRLKLAVFNRYEPAPPAVAFVRGFGLKRGAVASSVAHDSHNVVAAGVTDEAVLACVRAVFEAGGGIAVSDGEQVRLLELPVAGLMSREPAEEVAVRFRELNERVRSLGCPMDAPLMTLSFLALPVIPELKLTDRGLFDVCRFRPVKAGGMR